MSSEYQISDAVAGLGGLGQDSPCAVSFIVPAFQAVRTLGASIESIRAAAPVRSEIIIVDDGSIDDTLVLAKGLGDVVISRPCQGGAARSRNDGAQVARGEILFFIDSDVTVTKEAVLGALQHFERGADAVFGAYESLPPPEVRNVATTYKNLLHHYTHLQGAGEAETFWSGFGAVRREAFLEVHGFDAAVTTGADVEDIHLGYRLRAAGYRILLDPTLQVRHHKHYTVRGVIISDVVHRAVPWTRAMLQWRTFDSDLNLRKNSIVSALVSLLILSAVVAIPFLGWGGIGLTAALVALWLLLHRRFLSYVRHEWDFKGVVCSAGMLYLYYLYGMVGTVLGATAFFLRHERHSTLNWLRIDDDRAQRPDIAVSLALTVMHDEPLLVLDGLPAVEPWWELLVVAPQEPAQLPPEAQFIQAPADATRNDMRQLALERCKGEMFATLDAHCVPDAGWLDRVREAADSAVLVIGGPFHHDRRSAVHRAQQVVRYWQWRPERPAGWVVDHPSNNAAFRAIVARRLGGFCTEGALILRLAAFGAHAVRFDPAMGVRMTQSTPLWGWASGVGGVARLRASATVRYFDIGIPHRALLVAASPLVGALSVLRLIRQTVREGTADRSLWLGLPLIVLGLASHWLGRDAGLLRPRLRGGRVPRSIDDLADLEGEFPAFHAR